MVTKKWSSRQSSQKEFGGMAQVLAAWSHIIYIFIHTHLYERDFLDYFEMIGLPFLLPSCFQFMLWKKTWNVQYLRQSNSLGAERNQGRHSCFPPSRIIIIRSLDISPLWGGWKTSPVVKDWPGDSFGYYFERNSDSIVFYPYARLADVARPHPPLRRHRCHLPSPTSRTSPTSPAQEPFSLWDEADIHPDAPTYPAPVPVKRRWLVGKVEDSERSRQPALLVIWANTGKFQAL